MPRSLFRIGLCVVVLLRLPALAQRGVEQASLSAISNAREVLDGILFQVRDAGSSDLPNLFHGSSRHRRSAVRQLRNIRFLLGSSGEWRVPLSGVGKPMLVVRDVFFKGADEIRGCMNVIGYGSVSGVRTITYKVTLTKAQQTWQLKRIASGGKCAF